MRIKTHFLTGVFCTALASMSLAAELQVVALNSVTADLAERVGGDRIEVRELLDRQADAHNFEPTVRDVREMSDADLILVGGLGFEPYLANLRSALGDKAEVIEAGSFVEPLLVEGGGHHHHGDDHSHDHDHGAGEISDPHWWHSIGAAERVVGGLRDTFSRLDPDGAANYRTNATQILDELNELRRWVGVEVAKIPRSQRILVTSHDAFRYFADEFGFEVMAVQGISTGEQPSSKAVKELIGEIQSRGATAIFAESGENPKVLEEITRESGVTLGGRLNADGLSSDGPASTYTGMIRHNVSEIVSAMTAGQ